MTIDLRDQLRELCAVIDDEQGPLTVDYVRSRSDAEIAAQQPSLSLASELTIIDETLDASVDSAVEPGQPESDQRHGDDLMVDYLHQQPYESPAGRKGWTGVVVAVAATILVVVGVVVVADGNGGNAVTGPESLPGVADPVPSPSVGDAGSSLWSPVFHDQAEYGGDGQSRMLGVVAGGPGFVAVGGRDGNAAVWTSVHGLTWSRVPHDEAVFGGVGESGMSDVAVGGPGLVAVGQQDVCTDHEVLDERGSSPVDEDGNLEPETVCEDGNAVVWTSVDGLTWSRVPHDESVFSGQDFYGMSSVTLGGPGLVAVGLSDNSDGGDAVVWTSVDGLTWSRVPHDEAVFGGAGRQEMWDVTVGGPGLVAVGRDGLGVWDNTYGGGQDAAVWTSVDGLTWTRVPHDEDAFGGVGPAMLGVTTGGPGLVAVGYSWPSSAPAAVWTSVDGLTWLRVPHDNGAEMGGTMSSVTVGGPGLVAVGFGGQVWSSPDGLTWSLAANDDTESAHAGIRAVIAANGRLVAVGVLEPNGESKSAAAWTSPNP